LSADQDEFDVDEEENRHQSDASICAIQVSIVEFNERFNLTLPGRFQSLGGFVFELFGVSRQPEKISYGGIDFLSPGDRGHKITDEKSIEKALIWTFIGLDDILLSINSHYEIAIDMATMVSKKLDANVQIASRQEHRIVAIMDCPVGTTTCSHVRLYLTACTARRLR
jgi:hypothetical protein